LGELYRLLTGRRSYKESTWRALSELRQNLSRLKRKRCFTFMPLLNGRKTFRKPCTHPALCDVMLPKSTASGQAAKRICCLYTVRENILQCLHCLEIGNDIKASWGCGKIYSIMLYRWLMDLPTISFSHRMSVDSSNLKPEPV
jgi:hypothetical protein